MSSGSFMSWPTDHSRPYPAGYPLQGGCARLPAGRLTGWRSYPGNHPRQMPHFVPGRTSVFGGGHFFRCATDELANYSPAEIEHPPLGANFRPVRGGRKKAALVGCFVADAASMPLHWIYDNGKLQGIVGGQDPLFFGTPSCPFYDSSDGENGYPGHYQTGQLSPYGPLDGDQWVEAFAGWCRGYTGRSDHATKEFIQNVDAGAKYPDTGADDNQAQSFGKVAPLVLVYGDDPHLLANVEVCVRAHQNNELNVAVALFWAGLLQGVVKGYTIQAAFELAKSAATNEQLLTAIGLTEANLAKSTYEFLIEYGKTIKPTFPAAGLSCGNPQATMGALHAILTATSFEEGLTANLMAGGDNCSRATIVGAVLGAAFGVPDRFTAKLKVPELSAYLA